MTLVFEQMPTHASEWAAISWSASSAGAGFCKRAAGQTLKTSSGHRTRGVPTTMPHLAHWSRNRRAGLSGSFAANGPRHRGHRKEPSLASCKSIGPATATATGASSQLGSPVETQWATEPAATAMTHTTHTANASVTNRLRRRSLAHATRYASGWTSAAVRYPLSLTEAAYGTPADSQPADRCARRDRALPRRAPLGPRCTAARASIAPALDRAVCARRVGRGARVGPRGSDAARPRD